MSKALTKELTAVCMMSGVILWIEKEKALKLEQLLKSPSTPKFVEFEGQLLNVSSIEGIYSAATMDDLQRRKNGQWICKEGEWHDRFEKCACDKKEIQDLRAKLKTARAACTECEGEGYVHTVHGVAVCKCSRELMEALEDAGEKL